MIEQALKALRLHEAKLAHHTAVPVSLFASSYLRSKGSKTAEADWFDPFKSQLEDRTRDQILPVVASTFAELSREGKLPHWIQDVVDVQLILGAKTDEEE